MEAGPKRQVNFHPGAPPPEPQATPSSTQLDAEASSATQVPAELVEGYQRWTRVSSWLDTASPAAGAGTPERATIPSSAAPLSPAALPDAGAHHGAENGRPRCIQPTEHVPLLEQNVAVEQAERSKQVPPP